MECSLSCRALPEGGALGFPYEGFTPSPETRWVEERGVPRLQEGKLPEKGVRWRWKLSPTGLLFLPLFPLSLIRVMLLGSYE
ncbi:hypothetical protein U1Q18_010075 [Sarracenia purpurea var. burkii]